ncbi:MAG: hypothetical protein K0S24_2436 [Sphingobacterium sp.]|jgi:hypothetical protein|nr:hypothetical protein [Sphingobacterium sp.]
MANQFLIKETVEAMRNLSASEIAGLQGTNPTYAGIELLGYYEKGDTPTSLFYYPVSSSPDPDDGGSIIAIGQIKLEAAFSSGVDCKYFGAQRSDILPESEVISIFENWQNYVNSTDGKYFAPTKSATTYYLYKPLYIQKSFICQEDMPVWMYLSTAVGKVVHPTATTFDGRFDFNVKAVMGINPLTYSDSQDRLRFKNIKILCTNGDDDTIASQDIGVYFPLGTSFEMDNITVIRPNLYGFEFKENWMGILKRLNVWNSRNNAFQMIGTYTSLTVENCYAHNFANRGFNVNGAMYSVFKSLGADGGRDGSDCAYSFASCYGVTIASLGSEESVLRRLFYLGDVVGSIENVTCINNSFKEAIFQFHTDSNLTISGYKFVNCSQYQGFSTKSFSYMSTMGGANYVVTVNADTERIVLDGSNVAVPQYLSTVGKFVYNIIDNPYMVQNNVTTAFNIKIGQSASPPLSNLRDGMFFIQTDHNRLMFYKSGLWYPAIPNATVLRHGTVNQCQASADTATPPSAAYTQTEAQELYTEFRDLKAKLRAAGILAT